MQIKVYNSGSTECAALVHTIQCAITELGGKCELVEIRGAAAIAAAGVRKTPAWGIGDEIMSSGQLPSLNQIKADLLIYCQQHDGQS